MKPNVKNISIYDLKPNMILTENLVLDGVTLVAKEIALNSSVIKKIVEFYPSNTVHIYVSGEELVVPSSQNSREQSLIQTENILNRFSNKIDIFLDNLQKDSQPDLTEIKVMSKEILDNLSDYGSIIKNITSSKNIDEYLTRHCVNVALLSSMLGKWLNLPKNELTLLTHTAFLSDIGKTKINPTVLNKPSKLTNLEFDEVKKHSLYAYDLIKNIPLLDKSVILGVLTHHERLNGSGYPLGLKEDKISTFAKIIAIADTFDAMTSERVYSKKQNPLKVLEVLQHDCIDLLDYNYITTFVRHMSNYYTGEMVKLNKGSIGKIIKIDINNISKPLISVDSNFIDLQKEKNLFIIDMLP
ncbi:HD-GYP domain-containing protein [Clostridium frigoris]|uniref:HD-GYP domain-containing protein n=1 Tax=Clostridium frigoris TaxID=205327 RepID=A0ABS6BP52_9CLOT|nr:HD-GYP domain-containing protein [Clostridium frigoris]MBU3158280.1 HD-GYP domain-containing protein [Clostridium frigoris]